MTPFGPSSQTKTLPPLRKGGGWEGMQLVLQCLGIPASAIGSCLFVIVVRFKQNQIVPMHKLLINKSRYLS